MKATQQETEFTGKEQGAKRFSEKRGRGRRRTDSGVGGSRGRNTPRTQLRADIRDLIDSKICLTQTRPIAIQVSNHNSEQPNTL